MSSRRFPSAPRRTALIPSSPSISTTRTLQFGTPTEREKRAFTRVLQGHIAIDSAVFPDTTTGYLLDTWARRGASNHSFGEAEEHALTRSLPAQPCGRTGSTTAMGRDMAWARSSMCMRDRMGSARASPTMM